METTGANENTWDRKKNFYQNSKDKLYNGRDQSIQSIKELLPKNVKLQIF